MKKRHYTTRYAFNRTYSQAIHARNRALQRYALDLSPALSAKIAKAVQDRRARAMKGNVFEVDLQTIDPDLPDVAVIVAYDRRRKQIATFLPHDWTPESAKAHRKAKAPKLAPVVAPAPKTITYPDLPDDLPRTMEAVKAYRDDLIAEFASASDKTRRRDIRHLQSLVKVLITTLKAEGHAQLLERQRLDKIARLEREAAERLVSHLYIELTPVEGA